MCQFGCPPIPPHTTIHCTCRGFAPSIYCLAWLRRFLFSEGYSELGLHLQQFGLHEVAQNWQQVVDMNDYQKKTFTTRIIHTLFNTFTNKKISVFGFAFKKDTGNVRETPSLTVCRMHVYDPRVTREAAFGRILLARLRSQRQAAGVVTVCLKKASRTPHAIAVLTEWTKSSLRPQEVLWRHGVSLPSSSTGETFWTGQRLKRLAFSFHAVGSVSAAKVWGGQRYREYLGRPFRKVIDGRAECQDPG